MFAIIQPFWNFAKKKWQWHCHDPCPISKQKFLETWIAIEIFLSYQNRIDFLCGFLIVTYTDQRYQQKSVVAIYQMKTLKIWLKSWSYLVISSLQQYSITSLFFRPICNAFKSNDSQYTLKKGHAWFCSRECACLWSAGAYACAVMTWFGPRICMGH